MTLQRPSLERKPFGQCDLLQRRQGGVGIQSHLLTTSVIRLFSLNNLPHPLGRIAASENIVRALRLLEMDEETEIDRLFEEYVRNLTALACTMEAVRRELDSPLDWPPKVASIASTALDEMYKHVDPGSGGRSTISAN
jgi:hypothetical protein